MTPSFLWVMLRQAKEWKFKPLAVGTFCAEACDPLANAIGLQVAQKTLPSLAIRSQLLLTGTCCGPGPCRPWADRETKTTLCSHHAWSAPDMNYPGTFHSGGSVPRTRCWHKKGDSPWMPRNSRTSVASSGPMAIHLPSSIPEVTPGHPCSPQS